MHSINVPAQHFTALRQSNALHNTTMHCITSQHCTTSIPFKTRHCTSKLINSRHITSKRCYHIIRHGTANQYRGLCNINLLNATTDRYASGMKKNSNVYANRKQINARSYIVFTKLWNALGTSMGCLIYTLIIPLKSNNQVKSTTKKEYRGLGIL